MRRGLEGAVEPSDTSLAVVRFKLDFVGIKPDWHYGSFSEVSVDEWVEAGIEHVGLDLDGNLCPAYYHGDIDPDAIDKIAEMNAKMKTVTLTTNNEEDVALVVSRLGLSHCVQAYAMADLQLPYKPAAEFWQGWLSLIGDPSPHTVLQLGDNPYHDIQGAQDHGIQGALMDRWDPHGFFHGPEA